MTNIEAISIVTIKTRAYPRLLFTFSIYDVGGGIELRLGGGGELELGGAAKNSQPFYLLIRD